MKRHKKFLNTFWIEVSGIRLFYRAKWFKFYLLPVSDIEWPQGDEALSDEAVAAVESLLTTDPKLRPTAKDVHKMPFFASIDWDNLESVSPPFIPNPENPTDTGYFEGMMLMKSYFSLSFDRNYKKNFSSKYAPTFEIIEHRRGRLEVTNFQQSCSLDFRFCEFSKFMKN